ncbi:hypothetical protein HUU42_04305 [bacterium]|nr:hypothetical protein [bacterium]
MMALIVAACSQPLTPNQKKLVQLVERHQKQYPGFEIRDAYKLLFQSSLGVGHLIADTVAAKNYLLQEMGALNDTASSDEELIEFIAIDSSMIRVNLRPFMRQHLDPNLLFQAMMETAIYNKKTKKDFAAEWREFVFLVRNGYLRFDSEKLDEFNHGIALQNYPMIHHSEFYSARYAPAYRVVYYDMFKKYFNRIQ